MPAFSTHWLFAKDMLPYLKANVQFQLNENALFVGTQGPDIFFFHRALPFWRGKTLRKVGSAVHRAQCGAVLDEMTAHCMVAKHPDIAKSYVCGFLLHYALDRTAHPYVYCRQDMLTGSNTFKNANSAHNAVELSIDSVLLYEKLGVKKPRDYDTRYMFTFNETELSEIAATAAAYANVIAPLHFDAEDVKTALCDTGRVQGILQDKTGLKKAAAVILETLAGPFTNHFKLSAMLRTNQIEKAYRFMNSERCAWQSPFDAESAGNVCHSSFLDLYEAAKEDAKEMLSAWQAGCTGEEITKNISFLTGLPVSGE